MKEYYLHGVRSSNAHTQQEKETIYITTADQEYLESDISSDDSKLRKWMRVFHSDEAVERFIERRSPIMHQLYTWVRLLDIAESNSWKVILPSQSMRLSPKSVESFLKEKPRHSMISDGFEMWEVKKDELESLVELPE